MDNAASSPALEHGDRRLHTRYPFIEHYRSYSDSDLHEEYTRLLAVPKARRGLTVLRRLGSVQLLAQERSLVLDKHSFSDTDEQLQQIQREEHVRVAFVLCGMTALGFIAYKLLRIFAF